MKNIIKQIYAVEPLLAVDASYVLGVKVEAVANAVKKAMLEAIHDITGISVPAKKITIKKSGDKEIYTFTEDDTIFRITGTHGKWAFSIMIPRVGNKGLEDVPVSESASFIRSGHADSLDQIMKFFKSSLGQAITFLRLRKFAFDAKGNVVSTL